MAEFSSLPPEESLPEENPAPAPGTCPPPEEGGPGAVADAGSERVYGRTLGRRTAKNALLLAIAGFTLCGMIYTAPVKPAAAAKVPAEQPVTETPAAQPVPVDTEPAVLTAAQRLVAIGTWKNSGENEWVHFNEGGTGWWYDGVYFGSMVWDEDADGGVGYEASIAYLSPEPEWIDEHAPEHEGDCLRFDASSGSIALSPNEDCFSCPGLRFGDGSYLPDDTVIDASSVMDGISGKTAVELLSGTTWHMTETNDLGIPIDPSEDKGFYTDLVYVQSVDFAAGTIRLTTRDGGLLQGEVYHTGENRYLPVGEPADMLDVPFALPVEEDATPAFFYMDIDFGFIYISDYHPGDVEYNNMHTLWGRYFGPYPSDARLLMTGSGVRLGIKVDYYPNNYTLLALD